MWQQGIRVVCIDSALARERLELEQANAAAMAELEAVLEKRTIAERGRRHALRELKEAQEKTLQHELTVNSRKASRFRVDASVTNVQVEASLREAKLQQEMQRLRSQRASALSLLGKRELEAATEKATAEAASAIELLSARASALHERQRAEAAQERVDTGLAQREESEAKLKQSITLLEQEKHTLQRSIKEAQTAAKTQRA